MITLRQATVADLNAINDIYNHFVLHSTLTSESEPWHIGRRQDWFSFIQKHPHYCVIVALHQAKVIGFAYNGAYNSKTAGDQSTEVTIVEAHDCSLKGIGRALYKRFLLQLRELNFYPDIIIPNEVSNTLQQDLGFSRVGLIAQVGEDQREHHDDVDQFEQHSTQLD